MVEQPRPARPVQVGLLWLFTVAATLWIVGSVLEKVD